MTCRVESVKNKKFNKIWVFKKRQIHSTRRAERRRRTFLLLLWFRSGDFPKNLPENSFSALEGDGSFRGGMSHKLICEPSLSWWLVATMPMSKTKAIQASDWRPTWWNKFSPRVWLWMMEHLLSLRVWQGWRTVSRAQWVEGQKHKIHPPKFWKKGKIAGKRPLVFSIRLRRAK